MKRYLLDTNTVGYFVKGHQTVVPRLRSKPIASISISAITEGELRFGLAKRRDSTWLASPIDEFLRRAVSLPWDSGAATAYGTLRADLERSGKGIGAFDLLIAAQAVSVNAILVTADKAFHHVPDLMVEDWTRAA